MQIPSVTAPCLKQPASLFEKLEVTPNAANKTKKAVPHTLSILNVSHHSTVIYLYSRLIRVAVCLLAYCVELTPMTATAVNQIKGLNILKETSP